MAYDLILRSNRVVLPEGERPAAVCVLDGRIAAIALSDTARPARVDLDLGDSAVLPGLVDTHVHVNEPGRTEWEGFASATRAAAAGGVTTLIDMPLNSIPSTVDPAALAVKRRPRPASASSTSDSGVARSRATSPISDPCTRPASSGSNASSPTPASRSSRRSPSSR